MEVPLYVCDICLKLKNELKLVSLNCTNVKDKKSAFEKKMLYFAELDLRILDGICVCEICRETINIIDNFLKLGYSCEQKMQLHVIALEDINKISLVKAITTLNVFCRICLKVSNDGSSTFSLKDAQTKLHLCFPEIDLRFTETAVLCKVCFELLDITCEFRNRCLAINDGKCRYLKRFKCLYPPKIELKIFFECLYCLYTTKNESEYEEHLLIHTENVLAHKYCTYTPENQVNLQLLNPIHVKRFNCSLCTYQTNLKGNLRVHEKYTHCDDKPYQCAHCSYRVKRKYNLKNHFQVHILRKELQCPCCQYTSIYKSKLKAHLFTHIN